MLTQPFTDPTRNMRCCEDTRTLLRPTFHGTNYISGLFPSSRTKPLGSILQEQHKMSLSKDRWRIGTIRHPAKSLWYKVCWLEKICLFFSSFWQVKQQGKHSRYWTPSGVQYLLCSEVYFIKIKLIDFFIKPFLKETIKQSDAVGGIDSVVEPI